MANLIRPFGAFLKLLYDFTGNYGWALVLFTIAVNLVLLPLNIKQQKSMGAMQKIQPKLNEIQKKYQYDKEKQSQEMMKLYQEYKINPMSGCLPMLIQMPIILILYQAIYKPLTYMFGPSHGFTPEVVKALVDKSTVLAGKAVTEISVFSYWDKLTDLLPSGAHAMNFNFFGLDLSQIPNFRVPSLLWIIPVVCGLTTYALSALSTAQTKQPQAFEENPTANSMQTMQNFMPFMTAFFAFTLPAALGFYWSVSNIVRMGQQVYLNHRFKNNTDGEPEKPQGTVHPSKKKKGRK